MSFNLLIIHLLKKFDKITLKDYKNLKEKFIKRMRH